MPVWPRGVDVLQLGHVERSADLLGQPVGDLCVAGDGLDAAGSRIAPQRVRPAFALEIAAVAPQMP